ncbi:MAG: flagellar export chaperone FliS [Planctomycetota bacterium]
MSVNADSAATYLRTTVMTASPSKLRLLLLDGSLKFAGMAREGLTTKNAELSYDGFRQCRDIVLELATTINAEPDPEFADRVRSVYMFIYSRLLDASLERDIAKLDEAIKLLEYERETWVIAMEKAAAEGSPAAQPPHADDQTVGSITPANSEAGAGISIQA